MDAAREHHDPEAPVEARRRNPLVKQWLEHRDPEALAEARRRNPLLKQCLGQA